jgi:hypothetical protein
MSIHWKGNFIKFQWNNIFVYVLLYTQGKIHEKEAAAHDENKIVEMRTTTTKWSLGNASIRPHEMKFKSLEKTNTPRALAKEGTSWQHPTLGDVRRQSQWITHK